LEDKKKNKEKVIQIRVREDIKEELIRNAEKYGFKSLSEYLTFVGLNAVIEVNIEDRK
jgi:uncharacterized protein (DUF1778 family)